MSMFRTYRRGAAVGLGVTGLVAAQLAIFGSTAQAAAPGSVWIEGSTLRMQAAPGQVNSVLVAPNGGTVRVTDFAGNLAAQFPCVPVSAHLVDCPAGSIASFIVDTNDLGDVVRNTTALPGRILTGAGNDSVSDGPGNQLVLLGTGNDFALVGTGRDVVSGSSGIDGASYSNRAAAVVVALDNNANDGQSGEQDNVLNDVENITGGNGGDLLLGSAANNVISGLGGNDTIGAGNGNDFVDGGFGADNMFGGNGTDTVNYASRTAAVSVRLDNAANDGQSGEGDNARSDLETINGGAGNDLLIGSAANNLIRGLGGNDTISAAGGNDFVDGGFGRDLMFGGSGIDTTSYAGRTASVVVRLDNSANDGQSGEQDNVVSDIENVIGGNANDLLIGSNATNVLSGLNGNDSLFGLGGNNDLLFGGNGTDFGSGGAGTGDKCFTENHDASCE